MPELPEVETVRRQLEKNILNKRISGVLVKSSSVLRQPQQSFENALTGTLITGIRRIGKLLQFELLNEKTMLSHLKMTGQFLYHESGKVKAGIFPLLTTSQPGGMKYAGTFKEQQSTEFDRHTHIILTFEDGSVLAYRDVRKFGYLHVIPTSELLDVESHYGIDPLREEFTREAFHRIFQRRHKSLKGVLMDQSLIAGVGNIYADEICHRTFLSPERSASSLSLKQVDDLYAACSEIIQSAVERKGTTFRDFVGADGEKGNFAFELKSYGRTGQACLQCPSGVIQKTVHLGRGTHYCRSCQK
jgi:formamidopyrimidine-DNA glycosylase